MDGVVYKTTLTFPRFGSTYLSAPDEVELYWLNNPKKVHDTKADYFSGIMYDIVFVVMPYIASFFVPALLFHLFGTPSWLME